MEKKNKAATEEDRDPYGHPRIPYRGHCDRVHCDLRRRWIEQFTSSSLTQVGSWWDGEGEEDSRSCDRLKGNIENPIGLAKIPLAAAGPLLFNGRSVNGYAMVPCATTEGALVASITRGAAALTRSGGVFTLASQQQMIRAPSFVTRNVGEAEKLWKWLSSHLEGLRQQVSDYSQHAILESLTPFHQGRTLLVRFNFTTGDACGQNMVTTATWNACKWALEEIKRELPDVCVTYFIVESAASGDKQSSATMMVLPRGVHVQAEAWIPESILMSTLKIDLHTFLMGYSMMCDGHVQMGCLGTTMNVGNLLSAVFIATGQDPASITECANGLLIVRPATTKEIETKGQMRGDPRGSVGGGGGGGGGVTYTGVYVCLVLPGLVVGTVGGGTQLATQKECLTMMGCYGKDGIYRLAEIIAGFALGLDLSLCSAIASGQFASAHEKLGRNPPTNGLREAHLVNELFQDIVGESGRVEDWTSFDVFTGNSILSELTKRELSKKVGHFGFDITYQTRKGTVRKLPVVLKSKPTDVEVCNMVNKMAQGCGLDLAICYERYKMDTDFRYCSQREVELCRLEDPILKKFMPAVYHTVLDKKNDLYVVVMEHLSKENFNLLNTVDDVSVWTLDKIKVVLRDLAHVHSLYLGKKEWLTSQPWLEYISPQKMIEMSQLWRELLNHAHREFPAFWSKSRLDLIKKAVDNMPLMWSVIESAPLTLIHNDCSPRNICLRQPKTSPASHSSSSSFNSSSSSSPSSTVPHFTQLHYKAASESVVPFRDPQTLCMYDWELATVGVAQYDLAEFLCFTLLPSTPPQVWLHLLEFHREHLEYYSGVTFPQKQYLDVFHGCLFHFAMKRLAMHTMAHTHKDYQYLPRVVDTLFSFLNHQMKYPDFRPSFSVQSKL